VIAVIVMVAKLNRITPPASCPGLVTLRVVCDDGHAGAIWARQKRGVRFDVAIVLGVRGDGAEGEQEC
jgi:hypothetical protein